MEEREEKREREKEKKALRFIKLLFHAVKEPFAKLKIRLSDII